MTMCQLLVHALGLGERVVGDAVELANLFWRVCCFMLSGLWGCRIIIMSATLQAEEFSRYFDAKLVYGA